MIKRLPWIGRHQRQAAAWLRQQRALDRDFYRGASRWYRWLPLRPEWHYLVVGTRRGSDPHPVFSTRWYLERYPDVARAGLNPLVHFLRFGVHEGRLPSPEGVISDFPGLD